MNIDIGSRLKQHRQQKGLSQRALARLAGVTNGLISQIEQNSISPSIASLKKVLDVLSLSLADFFTGEDSEIDVVNPAGGHKPEFAGWRWEPMRNLADIVIGFKRKVYEQVVAEFAHLVR